MCKCSHVLGPVTPRGKLSVTCVPPPFVGPEPWQALRPQVELPCYVLGLLPSSLSVVP